MNLLALGLLSFMATPAWASDYVDFKKGDVARFENTRLGGAVESSLDKESSGWKHTTNFAGLGPMWIWTSAGNERVYVWSFVLGTYQKLVDFREPVGTKWRIDVEPCNKGEVTLGARNETVATRAGSFRGVMRLDLQTSCADGGVTSIWFAPKVGVIRWSSSSIAGPVTTELVSAKIAGVAYPKASGVTVTGKFPSPEQWINKMPVVGGPRAPKSMKLELELKNDTGRDLSYSFLSSQRYEITIYDATNRMVKRWSENKRFAMAQKVDVLKAGENWTFRDSIDLRGATGDLAEGDYVVVIEMTSSPKSGAVGLRIGARAPFTVRWAF